MKTILILILINFYLFAFAPETTEESKRWNIDTFLFNRWQMGLYQNVIEEIKREEGLVLNVYKCPANQNTIGYGHALKSKEKYVEIDSTIAVKLLIEDFNYALSFVDKNLSYNERLAHAKIVFNMGAGKYLKYKDRILDNPKFLLRLCHYRSNGKWVRSNHILKARQFELDLIENEAYGQS